MSLTGRLVRLNAGFVIIAVGVALNVRSELGLGPLFVVFDGLHEKLGITVGTAAIITNAVLFVLALAMRERPGLGTIGQVFLLGPLIDLALWLTPHVSSTSARAVYLVLSLLVLSFGAALYLAAALGAGPYDAVMWGLFHRLHAFPLWAIRIVIESVALLCGWLLGGEVGVGTVVVGLGIGPGIALGLKVLGAMPVRVSAAEVVSVGAVGALESEGS